MEGEAIEFDSYMVLTSDLELGDLRLLEVDNSLFAREHSCQSYCEWC